MQAIEIRRDSVSTPDLLVVRLEGKPKAKSRPQVRYQKGKAFGYTPKATRDAEDVITTAAIVQRHLGWKPLDGPVFLFTLFDYPVPKRSRGEGLYGIPADEKPDGDNLEKLVMDALNNVAYRDDSQAVLRVSMKFWAPEGSKGGTLVAVGRYQEGYMPVLLTDAGPVSQHE